MKTVPVKLNTVLAGPQGSGQPGQVIHVSQEQAKDLIDGKFAAAHDAGETAAAPGGAETAARAPRGNRAPRAAKPVAAAPAAAPAESSDSQPPAAE